MGEIASVFGLDVRLVLIQAVNFGLVLFVLWYFLYTPLLNLIDERRAKIIQGEVDAEKAAKELAEASATRQNILTEANAQADKIVAEGRDSGKQKEGEIVSAAQKRSEQLLLEAQAQGEESKRRLLSESKEEIARMVVLGAEKVLKKELDHKRNA